MIRILCLALLVAAASFSSTPAGAQPEAAPMLVSGAWLAERLDDPRVVIVHVAAQRAEYEGGHIPGARFLAYGDVATEAGGLVVELPAPERARAAFEAVGAADGARIVLYGDPMAAARAWATLDWLGHGDHASVLDGGLEVWRAEGRPVTRDVPPTRRGRLSARLQPERFVDAAWVRARLGNDRYALVDARPAAEYAGGETHGGMHAAGHVPGARNLYWQELLVSRERPVFRPRDELAARFRRAGAEPGDTVVAYCMIGMRASVAYFVARYLGYETRFYDGSWQDWSSRGLPARTEAEGRR